MSVLKAALNFFFKRKGVNFKYGDYFFKSVSKCK